MRRTFAARGINDSVMNRFPRGMKIETQLPPEPEPLKKDRGCAFSIVIIVFLLLLAAAGAWILLWSGGLRDADKGDRKPATEQRP